MKCYGNIISEGVAWGKAKFLKNQKSISITDSDLNQIDILTEAINTVSQDLLKKISETKAFLNDRISEIFQTHFFIVNDPIVIESSKNKISKGLTAAEAYTVTINEILNSFNKITNEYMLGRIVDILDATDKVKVALKILEKTQFITYTENVILILDKLKPSIIYDAIKHNIKGFISNEGYYTQHSGIIARDISIPGIVCKGIIDKVKEDDFIILNANEGEFFVNPKRDIIDNFLGGKPE